MGPTTVQTVVGDPARTAEDGSVPMVVSRTFFPIGPLNAAGRTTLEPVGGNKQKENGYENPSLTVERLG